MKISQLGVRTFIASVFVLASSSFGQKLQYPVTQKVDHTDTYFGTEVADPYRWLEDDTTAATAQWVAQENKVTFDYLSKIPFRQKIKERLEELYNYPKYSAPFRKGENVFFYKNDGLQNQSVLYIQKGLDGSPEVLLDPNKFSADGTTRLTAFALSKDGKYATYGISRAGSDWQDYCVMDMSTRTTSPDTLKWVKVSNIAWQGNGFYYNRYDAPVQGKELSSKNENHKVYFHMVGTPQSKDKLIYEDPAHPQRFNFALTTEDERFLYLVISERGKGLKGNSLFYRDLTTNDQSFTPIIDSIGNDSYNVVDNVGNAFLIRTDKDAPNSKIIRYDIATKSWSTVIPEKPEPLQGTSTAGNKLFITYMKDVTTRAYAYSLDGRLENEIQFPDLGSASGFGGERGDEYVFYTFTSFNFPPTIYRYDLAAKKSTMFRAAEIPGYHPADYVTEQVFYPSKDGTKIPMFIVYKKGLKKEGRNPTLLYAYGGFNITTAPGFSSLRLALLERGFVYASANIRGGGEYGEKWHEAGTKLHKQNVFDDFIAAAEWLIANKYTSPEKLAIQGGSNGGLLIGAVMNQRPDLFRVAIPQVGVMDMLRFHKFTIGWNWIPDYGSSDNKDEFKALYAYSPLQNIRSGLKYPATLITTADHDDRVVPAHSFKYAATLQEKYGGDNPVIIRIETKSGHGASSTSKSIELTADIFSFIIHNLGATPGF
ncbi:MAG TPA: prolyl oligopeptidase family serine peptidase [Bacteroidota bacterium]|nr:prolyl oligopeptidase family serine peptidase [Bacteroidota bacterium]